MNNTNHDLNEGWNSLAAEMLYACMDKGAPEEELSFYERRIRANGGLALDQACGTGRHLFKLLERGLVVHGADCSADAIRFAQMKADELNVHPVLFHQRMEDMDIPYKYNTIYIANGTFQVFYDRQTAIHTLIKFRNHLNPGGEILLDDIIPPDSLIDPLKMKTRDNPWYWPPEKRRHEKGEIAVKLWDESVDRFEQTLIDKREYYLYIDGEIVRTETHTLRMTYFYKYELILLLEKAGFSQINFYSDYTDKPAHKESKILTCAARI